MLKGKNMYITTREYDELCPELKAKICNGIGPDTWLRKFCPQTIWGMNVSEIGDIHDFDYEKAKYLYTKAVADVVFLVNLCRKIDTGKKWLKWLRQNRAILYFKLVLYKGCEYMPECYDSKPERYRDFLKNVLDFALDMIVSKRYKRITRREIDAYVYCYWVSCGGFLWKQLEESI